MHTLGYAFKPWTEAKAIADGASILRVHPRDRAENGVDDQIRFGHRSSRGAGRRDDARWTVEAERTTARP